MVFVDTSAAVMATRARRELIDYLQQRGALDPAHATRLDFASSLHEPQLDTLIGTGVVKQTMEGRYWFDRDAFELDQVRRAETAKKVMVVIIALTALLIAAVAIIRPN